VAYLIAFKMKIPKKRKFNYKHQDARKVFSEEKIKDYKRSYIYTTNEIKGSIPFGFVEEIKNPEDSCQ